MINLDEFINNDYSEYMRKTNELLENFKKVSKKAMYMAFEKLFETYPEIKCIHWNQYTPSYNDGDPCVFTIGTIDLMSITFSEWENYLENTNTTDTKKDDFESDCYGEESSCRLNENKYSTLNGQWVIEPATSIIKDGYRLEGFLEKIGFLLQDILGNDVEVFVTREGITVQEYEHD